MRFWTSFGVWLVAGLAASSKHDIKDTPRVRSTSGTIIGHRSPQRPDTFEFLGIKYGRAPVGELRFVPPVRYVAPPDAVYNASTWVSYSDLQARGEC
jgi:hypothetical protein